MRDFERPSLGGKTLVIPGASRGFGCGVAGGNALVVKTSGEAGCSAAARGSGCRALRPIDVWINDAGIGAIGRFWASTTCGWRR